MAEGPKNDCAEITPAMIAAGVAFVRDFYPAEWGGVRGISLSEARAVAEGVLAAALRTCEQGK